MKEFKVRLQSITDVKNFVTAASLRNCDVDVISGRYLVDAKSIMGLFSLDLSNPVSVKIHGDDEECKTFCLDVVDLIVND